MNSDGYGSGLVNGQAADFSAPQYYGQPQPGYDANAQQQVSYDANAQQHAYDVMYERAMRDPEFLKQWREAYAAQQVEVQGGAPTQINDVNPAPYDIAAPAQYDAVPSAQYDAVAPLPYDAAGQAACAVPKQVSYGMPEQAQYAAPEQAPCVVSGQTPYMAPDQIAYDAMPQMYPQAQPIAPEMQMDTPEQVEAYAPQAMPGVNEMQAAPVAQIELPEAAALAEASVEPRVAVDLQPSSEFMAEVAAAGVDAANSADASAADDFAPMGAVQDFEGMGLNEDPDAGKMPEVPDVSGIIDDNGVALAVDVAEIEAQAENDGVGNIQQEAFDEEVEAERLEKERIEKEEREKEVKALVDDALVSKGEGLAKEKERPKDKAKDAAVSILALFKIKRVRIITAVSAFCLVVVVIGGLLFNEFLRTNHDEISCKGEGAGLSIMLEGDRILNLQMDGPLKVTQDSLERDLRRYGLRVFYKHLTDDFYTHFKGTCKFEKKI